MNETLLNRLDRWNKAAKWIGEPDQWFPRRVFFGIFAWNFPILAIGIGAIGTMFYRSDSDPSGLGIFTPLNWVVELSIAAVMLATIIDFIACLWLRHLWNRRVRALRSEDAQ